MAHAGFSGEQHYRAVLTEDIVREARRLRAEGMSYVKMAARFGVSANTMRNAVTGNTWKQLDNSPYNKFKTRGACPHVSREGVAKIMELREAGHGVSEISRRLKLSRGTVRKYIVEQGSKGE